MLQGLPVCPCGSSMRPSEPADLAFCGLIGQDDVAQRDWTIICRENGWEDSIIRKGNAAKAFERKMMASGGIAGRRAGAAHCEFAGCGRWVTADADVCTAGHAQHEHAVLETMPF
jgi:hypothetical protein